MPTVNFKNLPPRVYLVTATVAVFGLLTVISSWTTTGFGSPSAVPTRPVGGPSTAFVPQDPRPASPAPDAMQVETVSLTARGFRPLELERKAGRFLFGIDNRLKPAEFSFEIVQEDGHCVRQLKLQKGQMRLRKLLNLQPGRYFVREVDHPEWSCSIVISR